MTATLKRGDRVTHALCPGHIYTIVKLFRTRAWVVHDAGPFCVLQKGVLIRHLQKVA